MGTVIGVKILIVMPKLQLDNQRKQKLVFMPFAFAHLQGQSVEKMSL